MIRTLKPTKDRGRRIEFDTPYGQGHVEWDWQGRMVSEKLVMRDPQAGDWQSEQQKLKRGGCCDPPTE